MSNEGFARNNVRVIAEITRLNLVEALNQKISVTEQHRQQLTLEGVVPLEPGILARQFFVDDRPTSLFAWHSTTCNSPNRRNCDIPSNNTDNPNPRSNHRDNQELP